MQSLHRVEKSHSGMIRADLFLALNKNTRMKSDNELISAFLDSIILNLCPLDKALLPAKRESTFPFKPGAALGPLTY